MAARKKVGILTGGGDCPGLNAVIRAVAKKLIIEKNMDVVGIKDGYDGLVRNEYTKLSYRDVSGILTLGGTILGTSNIANPYRYAINKGGRLQLKDVSKSVVRQIKKMRLAGLVCIGGDGTLAIANRMFKDGVPIVGVPKTIDNDIMGTDITFGFNSAVTIATEGIDRVHTTAQAHHRIMIVELMGRTAGWIALHAGVAGGGDIILLPEIPYLPAAIAAEVKKRHTRGSRFSIIVVAEGAKPRGGNVVVQRMVKESTIQARLGGVGLMLGEQLEKMTGLETRTVVMGHLQRGGSPTAFDRVLATELGTRAADMVEREEFGQMVGVQRGQLVSVALEDVACGSKTVPLDHPLLQSARSIGTCFGDEG
ncbi:MAG: ATP-dependent 6-phosphofructokinase [Candidatus Omnitrophica bacterium]|nr:ATP-dependent 6-phosphofructokinase [Candidatus Omnitrophota bacterium]